MAVHELTVHEHVCASSRRRSTVVGMAVLTLCSTWLFACSAWLCRPAGPNTVVGLAVRKGVSRSDLVARLVPAYVDLRKQLKGLGVPEVQLHEPILTSADAAELQKDFESSYAKLAEVGVSINLVTYYDDIGSAYSFVTK